MTNKERIQLIFDAATSAKMCIDEGRQKELDDFLWDIGALIDSGGISTLRPIIECCKEQSKMNNIEDLKESLNMLKARAKRIWDWW